MPTAEDVKKEAAAVLKPKPIKMDSTLERLMADAVRVDGIRAADVAKHDAIGKSIFADMYNGRAQKKIDDAAKAAAAEDEMVKILKARIEINEA